ncbi:MAG TPA: YggS family pyridoxal phosphate-dependent enzyme [Candidatus Limnocylindria bacterium]|nr:YggS family pyridoxal phosphate-dependent enzyme [Candidatus Limnocylindria bacterium]
MESIKEPQLTPALIRERRDKLMVRLRAAADAAGRDPDGFRLVAVTKGFGVPVVLAAREAGITLFGENRVQEAKPKVEALPEAAWHLVGRLQSNKARRALALFAAIHSIDSLELLERLERIAHDDGKHPTVLLQVNLSGEPTKGGFEAAWFQQEASARRELLTALTGLRRCRLAGLMTMAPAGGDPAEQHATFARLRELRDRLEQGIGRELPELSMGMTADAEAAVAEGATLVRVGTALFGPRPHA